MSCNDSDLPRVDMVVERHVELPASPETVWDELPEMLGDDVELTPEPGGRLHAPDPDGDRIGVVIEAVPAERLTFRWMPVEGDDPPSEVEIALQPSGVGTILRVRETRLDGAHLERSAFLARGVPEGRVDNVFDALADPTRRRIVERVGRAPATAGEIAERLPVTRQAVVKHLAVLEEAGLVCGERDGRRVVFRLTPGPFADAAAWMQDVGAAWDRRLDKLARRVTKPR